MASGSRGRRRRAASVSPVRKRKRPDLENILLFAVAAPLALGALIWLLLQGPFKSAESRKRTGSEGQPLLSAAKPLHTEIEAVRSNISAVTDSLQVVVTWERSSFGRLGEPDSVRIDVVPERGYPKEKWYKVLSTQIGDHRADTVSLPMPSPGQSVIGYSCAALQRTGAPLDQSCTPWQYVRPSAVFDSGTGRAPGRVVIQPSGLQVDPDVGGAGARWQKSHPNRSPWILINRTAVPDCTGPNLKPTVAKFCAFAVLPDGRKVKTASATNDSYCDELFVEWARERYS
jgi:hypothetical protein